MRKITFFLTLLLMYVGVTPMMATLVQFSVDTNKAYTIKTNGTYKQYLYQKEGKIVRSSVSTNSAQPSDESYYFRFVEAGGTVESGSQKYTKYYIQPVTDDSYYVYSSDVVSYGPDASESKKIWFVLHDNVNKCQCIMFANNGNASSSYWYTPGTTDIQLAGPGPTSIWTTTNALIIEEVPGYEFVDDEVLNAKKTELTEKIQKANDLLKNAGFSISPRQEVALQVTNPNANFYLSSNADHNTGGAGRDGAGIAGLIDGITTGNYYFHTRWGGTDPGEAHYIQVDLGDGQEITDFLFDYTTRDAYYNSTSPAPTKIEVYGGNSSSNVNNLITTFSRLDSSNPLPTHYDQKKTWTSNLISSTDSCRYLRFVVTESTGPGSSTKYNGYYFFCMAEFNLWLPAKPVVTNNDYKGQEDKLNELSQLIDEAQSILSSSNLNQVETAIQELSDLMSTFEHTVTIGGAKWSSLVLAKNAAIPANVTAYVVSELGSDWATLTEVEGAIPAEVPVLLNADPGVYSFEYVNDATPVENNCLKGTLVNDYIQAAENTTYYVLGVVDGEVGLYKALINKDATGGNGTTHFLNNANKAYLPVTTTQGANMMRFNFGGETTAIDGAEVESTVKTIYDLSGRKVSSMSAPGLYIVNGKKVLVK